jgi:hypothetical protein
VLITRSVWEETRTFFPLFLSAVLRRELRSVCVVGASDGKFVLPLARQGLHVLAIERDPLPVEGGSVVMPGPVETIMPGMRRRLADERLSDKVEIVQANLLSMPELAEPVDAVWTST